ncbi:N-acetylmuramic acid 6-phosphate etherase [Rhizobiales bacterium RZME27]|uniref:N-acetylmuramic acid 6-phosphate etherase n=1 Tax=Endobacterium cereale TaxID=2663029 RepID=A0A6A8A2H3_9HYPH|nr:N-acetylmuramic acid 6-phosphate etherase [Endobacterium cereale]MEB2845071.1 N-acetylmuramic acid 6-phosphate etherase [Endobacterium cereale]MQY44983.1 N-acetylmuramic acid 6-phosphate etherase [Endobacterium cereale]
MSKNATEARHDNAIGLDQLEPAAVLRLLADGQQAAALAVSDAIPAIAEAATLAADALRNGGRLIYVGAGSSGLMAMADALELPGTYGIARDRIVVLLAGGLASLTDLTGGPEDDIALAERDAASIDANDCVICVTASGSTPYSLTIAKIAASRGAKVIGLANNAGAPLFDVADVAVLLATPPEVVAGSTRMGAGTAQKIAFNMLSTLTAIKLGHVHDGHMVDVRADNEKLRGRATRIVSEIAGIDMDAAGERMQSAAGSVKIAVLLAAGAKNSEAAQAALARSGQVLRQALAEFKE